MGWSPTNSSFIIRRYSSPPETLPDESAYSAPLQKIADYAKQEYAKRTGKEASGISMNVAPDTMIGDIELLSDMNTVLDCYKIDFRTGIGTDDSGNAVYLSVYAKTFFADVEELGSMAKIDYEKKTGTACYVAESALNSDKTAVTVKSQMQTESCWIPTPSTRTPVRARQHPARR